MKTWEINYNWVLKQVSFIINLKNYPMRVSRKIEAFETSYVKKIQGNPKIVRFLVELTSHDILHYLRSADL